MMARLLSPNLDCDSVARVGVLHWHGAECFAFLHEHEGICFQILRHVHLPSPIQTSQELFLQLFPQLPLLLLLHFLYLGPFSPPLMISILIHFIVIAAKIAVKIRQLHSQNSINNIELIYQLLIIQINWTYNCKNSKSTIGNQKLTANHC